MTTTAILDVISAVQQKVPKCAESTVVAAYRRAVRRWCGQTRWLRQQLAGTLTANVAVYSLGSDPLLEIVDVPIASITLTNSGQSQTFGMKPSDPSTFNPNNPVDTPFTYAYLPEGTIQYYYTPNAAYAVTLTLALQPTVHAASIDSTLLTKWFPVFEAGALSFLFDLKGEAWYDPQQAARNEAIFVSGVNNGKTDVVRGYQSGTVMVKKRAWIVGP